ncbi:MAG TPA: glycosyltransferase family 4 protein [Tepidisphaeraceae bacterium]
MRILVAHNFYQQPGGEDQVFRSELALLKQHGHDPVPFEMHNDDVAAMGKLALAASTIWNRSSARKLGDAVRANNIDLVHFHNTFPLMSPAAYYAAHSAGAAVVQTLHNFRLLCPGANFFRDGKVCEKCLGKSIPLAGVKHKCYRDNRGASAATAAMLSIHRAIGTWQNVVDAYITPTSFARDKFISGGLPADRIFAKPNFVEPDPGLRQGGGDYAIFVGRLSQEKGLDVLLKAWSDPTLPKLKIVGDGPLADRVKAAVASNPSIEWLGQKPTEAVFDLIGKSALLVFPSECYETFGRTAVEAFATGTPVVASGHGAPGDVVDHGRTGLHFTPSDPFDLAAKVKQLLGDAGLRARMRTEVRNEYLAKYTGARNYDMLISIYERARMRHPGHSDYISASAPASTATANVPVPRT